MDWDKVWRPLVGALGLFCIFLAVATVLGVIQSHPGVQGDLVFAALSTGLGALLLRIRRKPPEANEKPAQQPEKQPIVRKEWLIAMAIMFVSLMVIVFTMCGGHVGTS